jgi:conjugal transfer mating pair stabilization protein TraN
MKKIGLLCALLLTMQSVNVWADANDDGKSFALAALNGNLGAAAKNATTANVPNYTANPPQLNMDSSPAGLSAAAASKNASDANAQYVKTAITSQPSYILDKNNDPLFQNFHGIENSSAQIVSSNYQGCTAVPVGQKIIPHPSQSCTTDSYVNFSCQTHYVKQCTNPQYGQGYPFTVQGFNLQHVDANASAYPLVLTDIGGGQFMLNSPIEQNAVFGQHAASNGRGNGKESCAFFTETLHVPDEEAGTIKSFAINSITYDDWVTISVNGRKVVQAIGANQNAPDGTYPCDQKGIYTLSRNVDLTPYFVVGGDNVITISHLVQGKGELLMTFSAQRVQSCRATYNYQRTCDSGFSQLSGTLLSSTCNGQSVVGADGSMVCEGFNETYQSTSSVGAFKDTAACQAIRAQGCIQSGIPVCTQYINGQCAKQTTSFNCDVTTANTTVAVCGATLVCPNGQCTADVGQTQLDATQNFQNAATKLSIAQSMATDLNANKISVFNGKALACTDKALGFSNCCNASGWGTDIGLGSCSADEKALGIARQSLMAHFVGSYTTSSALGLLKTKHKVYCTFGSKLSRIIQEQGRPQINDSWGAAKSPNCAGFTIAQIGQLNFQGMDLSEFYSDVMSKANSGSTPNSGGAASQIQADIQNYFK